MYLYIGNCEEAAGGNRGARPVQLVQDAHLKSYYFGKKEQMGQFCSNLWSLCGPSKSVWESERTG